jgi:predicted nucleic acid-binding protein
LIAYVDSSVLLRVVLGQAGALTEWKHIQRAVCSALVEVECLRTLDRLRIIEGLSDEQIVPRREAIFRLMEATEVVEITRALLGRAALPLPTVLGTLDAIHLVSALVWREHSGKDLVMATHDTALGAAARASGLRVVGI